MSLIKNYLDKIKNAIYGREVRQSIVDAIEQCYKDATGDSESILAVTNEVDQIKQEQEEINLQISEVNSQIDEIENQGVRTETLENAVKNYVDAISTKYNFLNYGGKKDDATFDCRESFQALVNEIAESGGGTIYVPEGTYFFSRKPSTIYSVLWESNVSVKGAGMGKTVFKIGTGDITDGEGYSLFYRTSDVVIRNASFTDFTVDGYSMTVNNEQGYSHKGKAIFFEGVENCVFRDLELKGTPSTAMGIDFVDNSVIDNVNCHECGRMWIEDYDDGRGGSIVGPGGAGIGIGTGLYTPENLKIINCTCINCGHYGIFLEHQAIFTPYKYKCESKGNIIANNIVHDCRYGGIGIRGGSDITIVGNVVYGNKYGITLDSGEKGDLDLLMLKNILLGNNTITSNTESGVKIHEQAIFDSIQIIGNIIRDNNKYGVDFSSEYSINKSKRNNLNINNNIITNNGLDVYIGSKTGTKNIKIDPQQFQDINSGWAYLSENSYLNADKYIFSNFKSIEMQFMLMYTTFPCCLISSRDESYNENNLVKGYSILIDENKKLNFKYCDKNNGTSYTYIFNEELPLNEKITLKIYKDSSTKSITVACNSAKLTSDNTENRYDFFINMFISGKSNVNIGREWQGSYGYGKYLSGTRIYYIIIEKENTSKLEYSFNNIGIDKKVLEINNSGFDILSYNGVSQQFNVTI